MNNLYLIIIGVFFVVVGCGKEESQNPPKIEVDSPWIAAVDISSLPEIEEAQPVFFVEAGTPALFLDVLKEKGINTVRLRLWHSPQDGHTGFEEVKNFAGHLKNKGFKIWLTVHFSDTWADPGQQMPPALWQGLTDSELQDSVELYTSKIVLEIAPDFIQIGNEINTGFLHPQGHITQQTQNFLDLQASAIATVRNLSPQTAIIMHFAGLDGADWFFENISQLDFDIIGLSYYPRWHGKSLSELATVLNQLSEKFQKDIVIAETAYPFTLAWNDWTNNMVGLNEQLILPDFPATLNGQRDFVAAVGQIVSQTPKGVGLCYWGAEWVAWKGHEATDGSPWENQALFDFQNVAVPALAEISR